MFYDILQKGPAMPEGSIFPDPQNDPFFNRLPSPDSKEQRHPIAAALPGYGMAKPPVNTRLSIPMPRWRFYLLISSGKERRRKLHLAADRRHNPLATKGDALFVLMGDVTFSFYPPLYKILLLFLFSCFFLSTFTVISCRVHVCCPLAL